MRKYIILSISSLVQVFAIYLFFTRGSDYYLADPVTALLIVGGGMQVAGQVSQANAAKAQGKMANRIAEYNASQMERDAEARMSAAYEQDRRLSRRARLMKGEQAARSAAAGLTIAEGSPLEALADLAFETSIDRALSLRGGFTEATSLRNRGQMERVQGKWAQTYGRHQARAGYMQAAGSALTTAFQVHQAWPGTDTNTVSTNTVMGGSARNFPDSAWSTPQPFRSN